MVSRMAIEDLEQLKEDGIDVTPLEVVRLNAFGLRVEKSTESPELSVLPRVAILGNLIFHEPTIGSEIWMSKASQLFDMTDLETYIQLRTYSLVTKLEELVDVEDREALKAVVKDFTEKQLAPYTYSQVMNALEYVMKGNNPIDDEKKPFKKKEDDEDEELKKGMPDSSGECCFEAGLMKNGILLKLGSPSELKKMTTSELQMLVDYKAEMKYGIEVHKTEHAKRMAEYFLVLDEIRNAHKDDKKQ